MGEGRLARDGGRVSIVGSARKLPCCGGWGSDGCASLQKGIHVRASAIGGGEEDRSMRDVLKGDIPVASSADLTVGLSWS